MTIKEASQMENIDKAFLDMGSMIAKKEIPAASNPQPFPSKTNISLPNGFEYGGQSFSTQKYLDSSYTQGLLIIQNDTIVYEDYNRGQTAATPHISWSVAKSFISALFGIAMEEGHIKSVEQKVEEYLPELIGSGYEGVRIKDVLQMSAGVGFDENYGDPKSDIQRWFKAFALGSSQDKFAATLENEWEPGTYHHYVSINTHVLGMIIVKATGKSLTDYLQEKIWEPLGAEYPCYWLVDNKGMEMALGGLNACLRDYARLGQLFLYEGNWKGQQIVPSAWVAASTTPDAPHLMPNSKDSAHPDIGYGYQWWIPDSEEGEFLAVGVFNQFIYINPTTRTVIAKTSANQNYYDTDNPYRGTLPHVELFRAIAHSLD
ncbi:MAG: serine hydrolase [Saprospiraceae bacterium]